MSFDFFNREEDRYGSAQLANKGDAQAAGLFRREGSYFGDWEGEPLFLSDDVPLCSFSGSGGMKTSAIAIAAIIYGAHSPALVNDPKGQIGAVVLPALAKAGTWAYFWNPFGIADNPQHSCNPYDFLRLDSAYLHADCAVLSQEAVPRSNSSNAQYFEQTGQQWYAAFLKADLEKSEQTSPPAILRIVNLMDTGAAWVDFIEGMLASRFPDVRQVAGDILYKSQEAAKEYTAIKSELVLHTAYLNDPLVASSLEGSDFSLSDLLDRSKNVHVFLNAPAEHLSYLAPAVRSFFSAIMLLKARAPGGKRVLLLVDEAPALGSFPSLERAIVYGRGSGIRCWSFWQSVSQIIKHHGPTAVQTFLGSSQLRQFFGVRDYQTAELVSNMLGRETLSWDDQLAQSTARKQAYNALTRSLFLGEDPFVLGADYAHAVRASTNRTKQQRQLLTPDEVLALPDDRQIAFVSGRNLKPLLAWKRPYFKNRELAGLYLADPYHPPTDTVQIMTVRGMRRAKVVQGRVPGRLSHLPQYRSGLAAWVEGYSL